MKTIFLPSDGNFWNEGTKVKGCFEGRITRGTLAKNDDEKHVIGIKVNGKIVWFHESLVTLDLQK